MTVSTIAVAGVVILAGVMVWRGSRARRQADLGPQDPLTLLGAQFARGEIDEREYLERRDALARSVH